MGNQMLLIERQTIQWPRKRQRNKQKDTKWLTEHYTKHLKDLTTWTPLGNSCDSHILCAYSHSLANLRAIRKSKCGKTCVPMLRYFQILQIKKKIIFIFNNWLTVKYFVLKTWRLIFFISTSIHSSTLWWDWIT